MGLRIVNGLSSCLAVGLALLDLGRGEIKDVKFADDESLMVLWCSSGELCMISDRLLDFCSFDRELYNLELWLQLFIGGFGES